MWRIPRRSAVCARPSDRRFVVVEVEDSYAAFVLLSDPQELNFKASGIYGCWHGSLGRQPHC